MRIRKKTDSRFEDADFLARVADALSHPARIAIVKYVASKSTVRNDVCNGDLVQFLDYSQATISQHVKKLVQAGLLQTQKQDKFTLYALNRATLRRYIRLLQEV